MEDGAPAFAPSDKDKGRPLLPKSLRSGESGTKACDSNLGSEGPLVNMLRTEQVDDGEL